MGLGKTVQIVALLSYMHASGAEGGEGPHLVIAPGSTLDQWEQCFQHWYPSLGVTCTAISTTIRRVIAGVIKYHGPEVERSELRQLASENGFNVVLSTLSYWERDTAAQKQDRSWFRSHAWEYMIFDEAHSLRKLDSARFKRLRKLQVKRKVLLTGTPVQNSMNELLCLLNFLDPVTFNLDQHAGLETLFDGVEPGDAIAAIHR